MKKSIYVLMAALMCFVMQSCEELENAFSFDKSMNITVNVDGQALQTHNVKVQTLVESISLNLDTASSVSIKVFDNGKPQIVAVTDAENNLLMLYRGAVTSGAAVTINVQSTTNALVTFNPLFGPIPAADYAALCNVIESANQYENFRVAVEDAITRGVDLTSTENAQLLASLHNLLRELCENAFEGQEALDNNVVTNNVFFNCFPLVVNVADSTVTLRTSANCPTYFGELTDAEGTKVAEINVPVSSRYAFMDYFNGSSNQNSFGLPAEVNLSSCGTYTFTLTCNAQSALLDFYMRLGNNALAALGADVDQNMLTILSPIIRRAIDRLEVNIEEVTSQQLMNVVSTVYESVVEYMHEQSETLENKANWEIGGALLTRLIDIYVEVRETTDALLRTSWNIGDENINDTITFTVSYDCENHVIRPIDALDIAVYGGNNQTAAAFATLSEPISVRVRDLSGSEPQLAEGRNVKFVVVSGDGSLTNTIVQTNSIGLAQTYWTLGSGASGQLQSVYAVVVDDQDNELTGRVYFNALVANNRYRVFLCCDWADYTNYASCFDVDFTVVNTNPDDNGNVSLFPSSGRQWDYNGACERYVMNGTYNLSTAATDMTIAMYMHPSYGNPPDGWHFRTDQYAFTLQGNTIAVQGNLIYDGFDHNSEYGAGCGTMIYLQKLSGNVPPAAKNTKASVPAGKQGMAVQK